MRTTEVAHLFAAQMRESAQASNLRFEGKTLYSYAEPIAKIIAPNVVLMTAHNFSMTTNKHLASARYALSHYRRIFTPDMHNPVQSLLERAAEFHAKAIAPRIKLSTAESHLDTAQDALETAREIARYLKQPMPRKRTFTLENAPRKAEAARTAKEYLTAKAHARKDDINHLKNLRTMHANALHFNPKAKLPEPPTLAAIQALQREADLKDWAIMQGGKYPDAQKEIAKKLYAKDTPEERADRQTVIQESAEKRIQKAFADMQDVTNHYVLNNLHIIIPQSHELYPAATKLFNERSQEIQAKGAAQHAERISKWRKNESFDCPRTPSALLRLSKDRIHVETSWGARVPASLTNTVYAIVKKCRDAGQSRPMSHMLGDYRWNLTNAQGGITVGCHDIRFEEIEGIFNALNG